MTKIKTSYRIGISPILDIEIMEDDKSLEMTKYSFHYSESRNSLVLNRYSECRRESSRHKFKDVKCWETLDRRSSTTNPPDNIPQIVIDSVLMRLFDEMKIEIDGTLTNPKKFK